MRGDSNVISQSDAYRGAMADRLFQQCLGRSFRHSGAESLSVCSWEKNFVLKNGTIKKLSKANVILFQNTRNI